jgi:hypothetical protein
MQIVFPFPTLHTNPFFRRALELWMLIQANDGFFPRGASRIETFRKYFAFIIFAIKLSGIFQMRQTCLASKALLKQDKLQKPIPP